MNQLHVDPSRPMLSFEVPQGSFVSMTGQGYAEQSSLLKCIYRTNFPHSGEIWYDSVLYGTLELTHATERQMVHLRMNEISYVAGQSHGMIPSIPVLDIVAERLLSKGFSVEQARAAAHSCLERMGVQERLRHAYPASLGQVEQQRIRLARALVTSPRLMLVDEPAADMDEETKRLAAAMLKDLKREGTTILGCFEPNSVLGQAVESICDWQCALICVQVGQAGYLPAGAVPVDILGGGVLLEV